MGEMIVGRGEDRRVVETLSVPCDCSFTSISEAVYEMWPEQHEPVTILPLVFTVHVSVHHFQRMRSQVKELNGPMPPQFNLAIDYELDREAWYVSDGMGKFVGSWGA